MKITGKATKTIALSTFVVIICCLLLYMERASFQDSIIIFTALVGAVSVWFEMKRSKDMAEGEFILTLNESFSQNEDVKELYKLLVTKQRIEEQHTLLIVEYLTYFETIYVLIKKGVVDFSLIDNMFAYRFFLAVENRDIQRLELIKDAKYYKNIYTLDYLWRNYRIGNQKDVSEENSLSSSNADYLKYVEVKKNGSIKY